MDPRQIDLDAYDEKILALIAEHGIAVQGVGAGDGEPQFGYTVGLARLHQPEFLLFGLPMRLTQTLLNDIGLRVYRGEMAFSAGDTVHHLVADFPVRLLAVTDSSTHLTMPNHLYGHPGAPIPALQIVYPDADRRWPWEPGARNAGMPLLGPVPDDPGREITLPDLDIAPDGAEAHSPAPGNGPRVDPSAGQEL